MDLEENEFSQEGTEREQKRHRKKKLLKQLKEQMEFYFSSANLSKDKFMANLLASDPYIDIEIFFKFNKIRTITEDIDLLRKAIKKSSLINLSEDETKVTRKIPIQEKNDELECTIYIEKLPLHVTHEWVRKLFSQYGTIDYVSIPRYKHSGRPKGFAFLEFQTPEMAKVALEAFGVKDDEILENTAPADLQSIKTYEGDDKVVMLKDTISETNTISMTKDNLEKKMKVDTDSEEISLKGKSTNKRKLCQKENETEHKVTEGNESESGEPSNKIVKCEQNAPDESDVAGNESEVIKKKKKKRKKTKVKEQESESIYLRVMSKKQWKNLRNKYLNLQRKNMQVLKKQIKTYQDQSDWNPYLNKQSDNYEKEQSVDLNYDTKNNPSFCTQPKFIPNVVLKISFEDPPPDPRKLRETIRNGGGEDVAYVEVSSRESDIYVRFKSQNSASSYLNGGCWSRMEILKGEEEKKYWDHVLQNWEERRAKRNKKDGCGGHGGMSKNIRGKDKIVQKAFQVAQKAKPNSHVIFED